MPRAALVWGILLVLVGMARAEADPPEVLEVDPPVARAGEVVTVTGNGFGERPEDNEVTVGGARGKVVEVAPAEESGSRLLLKVEIPPEALGDREGIAGLAVSVPGRGTSAPRPLALKPVVYVELAREAIPTGSRTVARVCMGGVSRPARLRVAISPPAVATFPGGRAETTVETPGGRPNEVRLEVESREPGEYTVDTAFLGWIEPEPTPPGTEPADGARVEEARTWLRWDSGAAVPDGATFGFRLWDLPPGQTALQAAQAPPRWQAVGLDSPASRVDLADPGLGGGPAWCWQAFAERDGSVVGESPLWTFEFQPPPPDPAPGHCKVEYEWCAGSPIQVESAGFYPTSRALMWNMRPGDLVALSVLASDSDHLLQRCVSPDGVVQAKHEATPDRLVYEWTPERMPGDTDRDFARRSARLVGFPGGGSVLYQLPHCSDRYPDDFVLDRIRVRIRNAGDKADDAPVEVLFRIGASVVDVASAGNAGSRRRVEVEAHCRQAGRPGEVPCPEISQGTCEFVPPDWNAGLPLSSGPDVEVRRPPDGWPDNLVLLRAAPRDRDDLTLRCRDGGGRVITQRVEDVHDEPRITWSVKSGSGSFPLGNRGREVVFRQAYGRDNPVVVACRVEDSWTQFGDRSPAGKVASLPPRFRPMAFIGVGDMSLGPLKRWHQELVRSAEGLQARYAKAGYDAKVDPRVTEESLAPVLRNPRLQALVLLGHGSGDGVLSGADGRGIDPGILSRAANDRWGCLPANAGRHPSVRDVILLGCSMGRAEGEWGRRVFNLDRFYGYSEDVVSPAGDTDWAAPVVLYATRDHFAFPPLVPDP